MTWEATMFDDVTTEITAALPVVIPVAIGVFAIGLALRYSKKVLRLFS